MILAHRRRRVRGQRHRHPPRLRRQRRLTVTAIDRSDSAHRSVPGGDPRPSDLIEAADWERAHAELVEDLRELIRIPSVNPPPAPGDGELRAARRIAAILDRGRHPVRRPRARARPRLRRGTAPRRRHGGRSAPAPVPPRRGPGTAGRLVARSVRGRPCRRLRLGSRRRRHEGDGGAGDRRHPTPRGRGAGPPDGTRPATRFRA